MNDKPDCLHCAIGCAIDAWIKRNRPDEAADDAVLSPETFAAVLGSVAAVLGQIISKVEPKKDRADLLATVFEKIGAKAGVRTVGMAGRTDPPPPPAETRH